MAQLGIIIIILVVYLIYDKREEILSFLRKGGGRRSSANPSASPLSADKATMEALVERTLRSLNCETEWEDEKNDRLVKFDYQSGHFNLRVENNTPYVRMTFPCFFVTPLENISLVRNLCNQSNINSENERIVYSTDDEKHEVNVHIIASMLLNELTARDILVRTLDDIFSWKAAFVKRFSELLAENGKEEEKDMEKNVSEWMRELFMLRQQELNHQPAGEMRQNATDHVTLGQFVDKAMGIGDMAPSELIVLTDHADVCNDSSDILRFDLSSPLVSEGKFVRQSATLNLTFFSPKQPDIRRQMTFSLKAEDADEAALYYRVTAMVIPLALRKGVPFGSSENQVKTASALVAFDLKSPKHRVDEFRYMWKEALEKLKDGDESSLTEEQLFAGECMDPQVAQNLYRGKQLFLSNRYYEALLFLENAYFALSSVAEKLKAKMREKYFETCYLIGFCYTELRQFERAYFFLDLVSGLHRITYTEEMVNCLVNSRDYRALSYIDGLMAQLAIEHMDDEDDTPQEHIVSFLNFLKRRKAYVLVDRGNFADAKKLLNEMLEEPDNSDFAINELAYLQKMEAQVSNNGAEDAPQPLTSDS